MANARRMLDPLGNCEDFRTLYATLIRELSGIGINDAEVYVSCRKVESYFSAYKKLVQLERSFGSRCADLLKHLPDLLTTSTGLSLLIMEDSPRLTIAARKKLNVFAASSYATAGGIGEGEWEAIDVTRMDDAVGVVSHEGDVNAPGLEFHSGPDLRQLLSLVYHNLPEVKSGALTVIPREIRVVQDDIFQTYYADLFDQQLIESVAGKSDECDTYERDFDIARRRATTGVELPASALRLSLNAEFLHSTSHVLSLGLVLPSLDGVPIQIVRKLRADYEDEFRRFQKELARLAWRFEDEGDERKLKLVLEEVDEAVRDLDDTFSSIRRVHKSLALTTGVISLIFCFIVKYPELAKHLHALFSGIGTVACVECFRNLNDAKRRIDATPFMFPLRILRAQDPLRRKRDGAS